VLHRSSVSRGCHAIKVGAQARGHVHHRCLVWPHPASFDCPQLSTPVDLFVSHDWPRGIVKHGNESALLKRKPFLKAEIEAGSFGSAAGERVLHTLRPPLWLAAHMHTRFEATVHHADSGRGSGAGGGSGCGTTRFLALDKCMPGRKFLTMLQVDVGAREAPGAPCFEYDEEWLAIVRGTHEWTAASHGGLFDGGEGNSQGGGGSGGGAAAAGMREAGAGADLADLLFVQGAMHVRGGCAISNDWEQTATPHSSSTTSSKKSSSSSSSKNSSSEKSSNSSSSNNGGRTTSNKSGGSNGGGSSGGGGTSSVPRRRPGAVSETGRLLQLLQLPDTLGGQGPLVRVPRGASAASLDD